MSAAPEQCAKCGWPKALTVQIVGEMQQENAEMLEMLKKARAWNLAASNSPIVWADLDALIERAEGRKP